MATTNTATHTGPEAGPVVYDGFISYSHAADDLLAPRLQAGLQRFAKPWWKRRALRIFRDEASLSANPHLWSSITEAMDQSDWFVLLLSEAAAESVWVDREVAYWLEHKDPSRIIPVVTDGEFGCVDGDISPDSTAAPPSLRGAFTDEPRWVDLRFARTEAQLDLRHGEFRSAIADIASAIRGVPKDELESEEIRRHRRTIRTAWATAIALLLLVAAASVATVIAVDRSNEARNQRDEAQRLAQSEAVQRAEAETQADIARLNEQRAIDNEQRAIGSEAEAEAERDRADDEARAAKEAEAEARRLAALEAEARKEARSRELAASAINVLDDDPELSVLLAVLAADQAEPTFESVSALHEALQAHRTLRTITWLADWPMGIGLGGSISPDGRYLAVSGLSHQLAVWDLEEGSEEPLWLFDVPYPDYAVIVPYFTKDGSRVVATVAWFNRAEHQADWPEPPPEVGVYVFDARTGAVIRHIRGPDCPILGLFQSSVFLDEQRVIGAGVPASEDCAVDLQADVWLLDLKTGEMTPGYDEPVKTGHYGTPSSLSADGRYLSLVQGFMARVIDLQTGDEVFQTEGGGERSLLTRDGSRLLAADQTWIALWDLNSRSLLWRTESPERISKVEFSDDESLVHASGFDGAARIWDADTGELLHELKGHHTYSLFTSITADGTTMASFSGDGTVRIWDLTAKAEGEITGFDLPGENVLQSGKVVGDRGAILNYRDSGSLFVEPGTAIVFNVRSGEIEHLFEGYGWQMVRLSHDGTLLAGQPYAPGELGPVHIRDVETGHVLVVLEDLCTLDLGPPEEPGFDCAENPDSFSDHVWWVDFSPDGSMLAVSGYSGISGVWDVETGERLVWLTGPRRDNEVVLQFSPDSGLLATAVYELTIYETEGWTQVAKLPIDLYWFDLLFTPDGRYLIGADVREGIVTIDTTTWEYIGEAIPHESVVRDIDLSDDGTLIASASSDGFVRVWSTETGEPIQEISLGGGQISLIEFIDERHLLAIPQGRPASVITIDVPELVEIARSQVTRGFTEDECTTYHIDPCLTLDEIRSGRP